MLTALWGWCGWLVFVWILAMGLDYISGTMKAKKLGTWSSTIARDGLWHKASEVIAVLAALLLDVAISVVLPNVPGLTVEITYSFLLCPMVTVWYIVTEAGSVVENVGEMGGPVPPRLRKAIAALRDTVDGAADKETEGESS
ncbi:MAG: phage holin family protein [Oscillospiraceae bacterium]|nr:phage holin family protein [Oscillospiraceae bacterium]